MRSRLASFSAIALVLALVPVLTALSAHASGRVVLAQTEEAPEDSTGEGNTGEQPGDSEVDGSTQGEGTDGSGDESTGQEGSGDESTEVDADKGETEPVAEETGPPWTYQMARIVLVLLLFLILGIAAIYYRLVVSRRKGIA